MQELHANDIFREYGQDWPIGDTAAPIVVTGDLSRERFAEIVELDLSGIPGRRSRHAAVVCLLLVDFAGTRESGYQRTDERSETNASEPGGQLGG